MTGKSWNCSSDQKKTWHAAFEMGLNGLAAPAIDSQAKWIWTGMHTWNQFGATNHKNDVICQMDLGMLGKT